MGLVGVLKADVLRQLLIANVLRTRFPLHWRSSRG
jgi:hypothetical protein